MQTNKWLLSLVIAMIATNVYALPEVSPTTAPDGANIHPVAPNATHMHIEQTAPNAVVNWQRFNVAANESVHFQQPSANSIILNRVDARQGASTIAGHISANGRVIISNAAGIHFTPTSRVDVAGLIATTANITNENFKKGKYIFEDKSNLDGKVINEGIISINAKEHGFAALVAPHVANKGVITASLGKIAMYSTDKFVMNFSGNHLINFEVPDRIVRDVVMQGDVIANVVTFNHTHANEVLDHVMNVPAHQVARSVSQRNGVIILSAQPNADVHVSEQQGRVTVELRRAVMAEQQVVRNNMSSAYLFDNYLNRPFPAYADDGRLSRESNYFTVEDVNPPAQREPARGGLVAQYLELESRGWATESISSDHHSVNGVAEVADVASVIVDDGFELVDHAHYPNLYPALTAERLAQHNLDSASEQKWDTESVVSNGHVSFNSQGNDSLSPSSVVANRVLERLDADFQNHAYISAHLDPPMVASLSNRSSDADWERVSSLGSETSNISFASDFSYENIPAPVNVQGRTIDSEWESATSSSIVSMPSIINVASGSEQVPYSPIPSDWELVSRSNISVSHASGGSDSSIQGDVSAAEFVVPSPMASDWELVSGSNSRVSDTSISSGSSVHSDVSAPEFVLPSPMASDWEMVSRSSSRASDASISSGSSVNSEISDAEFVRPSPISSDWEMVSRNASRASDISSISSSSLSSSWSAVSSSANSVASVSSASDWELIGRSDSRASDRSSISSSSLSSSWSAVSSPASSVASVSSASDWEVIGRSDSRASDISSLSSSSLSSSWSAVSSSSNSASSVSSASEAPSMHLAFRFNSADRDIIVPNDVEADLHLAFRFDPNLARDIVPINNDHNLRWSFRFNDEARVAQQPVAVMDANGIIRVQPQRASAEPNANQVNFRLRFVDANNAVPNSVQVPNSVASNVVQAPGGAAVANNPQNLHLNLRFADGQPVEVQQPVNNIVPRVAEPDAEPNPEPNPGPYLPWIFRFDDNVPPQEPVDLPVIYRPDPVNHAPVLQKPVKNPIEPSIITGQPQAPQTPFASAPVSSDLNTPNKIFIQCGAMKYVNTAQGWELRCHEDFDLKPVKDVQDLITYPSDKPGASAVDIEV